MLGKLVVLSLSRVLVCVCSPVFLLAAMEDAVFPLPWAVNHWLDIYLLSFEEGQQRECNGSSKHILQCKICLSNIKLP